MLEWRSDTHLVVDGVDFTLAPTGVPDGRETARQLGGLLLRKARWMVERYAALVPGMKSANVMELGIYDGGSTALLALMFHPEKLVACDLIGTRVAALDTFIETHDLSESVRAYYGVDQADRTRLQEIVAAEFGSEPLDLVIDDASHLLEETTASFNVLFRDTTVVIRSGFLMCWTLLPFEVASVVLARYRRVPSISCWRFLWRFRSQSFRRSVLCAIGLRRRSRCCSWQRSRSNGLLASFDPGGRPRDQLGLTTYSPPIQREA